MALSAMELQLGVFRFSLTNKQNKTLHALRQLTHVYLHARMTGDAGDIGTWQITVILIMEKTEYLPIGAPCREGKGAYS